MKNLGPLLFLLFICLALYIYNMPSITDGDSVTSGQNHFFEIPDSLENIKANADSIQSFSNKSFEEINPFRTAKINSGKDKGAAQKNPTPINRGIFRLKGISGAKSAIIELPNGQTVVAELGEKFDSVKLIKMGDSFILLQDKYGSFKVELGED